MNLDNLFNEFHNNNNKITKKQIEYFNNIFDNFELNRIFKEYNINSIDELKYYQVNRILKYEINITNDEIIIIKNFFGKETINIIINIFKKNNIYINNEIKLILNEDKNDDKNIYKFLFKLKKKDINYIYSEYPYLTFLNNKFKIFTLYNDIPIISNENYEYGYQIKKFNNKNDYEKFYYIKFYYWATFDIDNCNFTTVNNLLNKFINISNKYIFALYETNNGFHIHIMNKKIEYNSSEYKKLSKILNNDIWYYNYSKILGYKIRLSKKHNNDFISKFINYYIPYSLKDFNKNHECYYYKNIYEQYLNKFKK